MLDLRRMSQFSYERPAFGDDLHGDYTPARLLEMNSCFVAAVTAAFQAGLESRAAASATVVTKRRVTENEAIQAAWNFLWQKDGDLPFAAIVAFVRARCPGVDPAYVRAGFERRFKRRSAPTSSL